jgi:hypothetical protein
MFAQIHRDFYTNQSASFGSLRLWNLPWTVKFNGSSGGFSYQVYPVLGNLHSLGNVVIGRCFVFQGIFDSDAIVGDDEFDVSAFLPDVHDHMAHVLFWQQAMPDRIFQKRLDEHGGNLQPIKIEMGVNVNFVIELVFEPHVLQFEIEFQPFNLIAE